MTARHPSNLCPSCKTEHMAVAQIEPLLSARQCQRCNGYWIRGEDYFRWLEHPDRSAEGHAEHPAGEVRDTPQAMLCPDCGRLLTRYRVGHGIGFCVNHCGGCGGIWLDANEWESLQARRLSDRIHMVFSAAWQSQILRQRQKQAADALLSERIGAADFDRLRELTQWIEKHPRASEITAFLLEHLRGLEPPRSRT